MSAMAPMVEREQRRDVKAARVNIQLVLTMTEGMFRHRRTLNDSSWEKALDSGKKILKKSQAEPETRYADVNYRLPANSLIVSTDHYSAAPRMCGGTLPRVSDRPYPYWSNSPSSLLIQQIQNLAPRILL